MMRFPASRQRRATIAMSQTETQVTDARQDVALAQLEAADAAAISGNILRPGNP